VMIPDASRAELITKFEWRNDEDTAKLHGDEVSLDGHAFPLDPPHEGKTGRCGHSRALTADERLIVRAAKLELLAALAPCPSEREQELEREVARLRGYAQHKPECALLYALKHPTREDDCDCGLQRPTESA